MADAGVKRKRPPTFRHLPIDRGLYFEFIRKIYGGLKLSIHCSQKSQANMG